MTLCLRRAITEHWLALWCNHVQAYGAYVNPKCVQAGRTVTPLAMAAYAKQCKMEQLLKSRAGVGLTRDRLNGGSSGYSVHRVEG